VKGKKEAEEKVKGKNETEERVKGKKKGEWKKQKGRVKNKKG
jgi:hypothetical protein